MPTSNTPARRRPVICILASLAVLLIYLFSIATRTEFFDTSNERYTNAVLAGGALAAYSMSTPRWADQTDLRFAGFAWPPEFKLLPGVEVGQSNWAVALPLWIAALPVWLFTVIRWHRARRFPREHCQRCGYDLRGLEVSAGRCPECGTVPKRELAT